MRFVDVKNDVAFRKIFGSEHKKVILISFLNAVLELQGHDRVKDVVLLNPFQLPRIVNEKASVIDVKAQDERGVVELAEERAVKRGKEEGIEIGAQKTIRANIERLLLKKLPTEDRLL